MELNYINEFVVLARVLHFQEAADLLFIGQSSLSKHIKSIETELGEDLFIRSKKKLPSLILEKHGFHTQNKL